MVFSSLNHLFTPLVGSDPVSSTEFLPVLAFAVPLAPDEQIEVFRIVQEGLANVRKHANATRAEVVIGDREGERFVSVRDDGDVFDGDGPAAGQGLKNMRARADSIDGGFSVTSRPGWGTALEVVLRA